MKKYNYPLFRFRDVLLVQRPTYTTVLFWIPFCGQSNSQLVPPLSEGYISSLYSEAQGGFLKSGHFYPFILAEYWSSGYVHLFTIWWTFWFWGERVLVWRHGEFRGERVKTEHIVNAILCIKFSKTFNKNLFIYKKFVSNVSLQLKHNSMIISPHCKTGSCSASRVGLELRVLSFLSAWDYMHTSLPTWSSTNCPTSLPHHGLGELSWNHCNYHFINTWPVSN